MTLGKQIAALRRSNGLTRKVKSGKGYSMRYSEDGVTMHRGAPYSSATVAVRRQPPPTRYAQSQNCFQSSSL